MRKSYFLLAWAVQGEHDSVKEPYGGLWRESYTTLAKLYDMTVVGVSNVGWIKDKFSRRDLTENKQNAS